jgi:hypothetical protein
VSVGSAFAPVARCVSRRGGTPISAPVVTIDRHLASQRRVEGYMQSFHLVLSEVSQILKQFRQYA